MTRQVWDTLLQEVRKTHEAHVDLRSFCAFPTDIIPQDVAPFHIPAADLFTSENDLADAKQPALWNALRLASPHARWRETYKDTDIGDDFMSRFGCYCIIGDGGAFSSRQMWAWMVYMPAELPYPFHEHPGEEIYLVIAGSATFHAHGKPARTCAPGDTVFHAANQPHATDTHSRPLLALVLWRNGFDSPPVLTPTETT